VVVVVLLLGVSVGVALTLPRDSGSGPGDEGPSSASTGAALIEAPAPVVAKPEASRTRQRAHAKDADAGVALPEIEAGSDLSGDEHEPWSDDVDEVAGADESEADYDVETEDTAKLVVVVAKNGVPAPNISVYVLYDLGSSGKSGMIGATNAQGEIHADVVTGDSFHVHAMGGDEGDASSEEQRAEPGGEVRVHLALTGLSVSGVAVDADTREPLAELRVRARQPRYLRLGRYSMPITLERETHTDDTGRFTLRGLQEGEVTVEVEPVGLDVPRRGSVEAKAGSDDVVLHVRRVTVARITSRAEGGEPIPDFSARYVLLTDDRPARHLSKHVSISRDGRWPPDGCVEIDGAGPHRVLVDALGFDGQTMEVSANPEGAITDVAVVLRPSSPADLPILRVVARDAGGAPAEGVGIHVVQGGLYRQNARTTSAGSADVELFEGPNEVKLCPRSGHTGWTPEWMPQELTVHGEQGDVTVHEVTVVPAGAFELTHRKGEVVRAEHESGVLAVILDSHSADERRWYAGPILTGRWTIRVDQGEGQVLEGTITVSQGHTSHISRDRHLAPVEEE